jgi:hypothetical protein
LVRPHSPATSDGRLPPLAAEDHACAECAVAYPNISIEHALEVIMGHDWRRIGTRLPGEQRTARWRVRQAVHEGVHHLGDIRRIGHTITANL